MLTTIGEVPIVDIRVGDRIIAVTIFGEIVDGLVNGLLIHPNSSVTELETEVGVLRTTDDHPFWVGKDEYIAVRNLRVNDMIVQLIDGALRYVQIKDIRRNTGVETTYNLSVNAPNTFVAGGMVVHNFILKAPPGPP